MSNISFEKEPIFSSFDYINKNHEIPNFLNKSIDSISYILQIENNSNENYNM